MKLCQTFSIKINPSANKRSTRPRQFRGNKKQTSSATCRLHGAMESIPSLVLLLLRRHKVRFRLSLHSSQPLRSAPWTTVTLYGLCTESSDLMREWLLKHWAGANLLHTLDYKETGRKMHWLAPLAAESHRSTEQQLLQLHAPQLMLTWWNMYTYVHFRLSEWAHAGSLNTETCRWELWAFHLREDFNWTKCHCFCHFYFHEPVKPPLNSGKRHNLINHFFKCNQKKQVKLWKNLKFKKKKKIFDLCFLKWP
jgi:hypothetical protein